MPKYSYALTNGKTLTLDGDSQPSDSDVEQIAKEQGVSLAPNNGRVPGLGDALDTLGDMFVGAAKGAGSTAVGLGQLVQKIPGVTQLTDKLYGLPPGGSEASMVQAKNDLAATNTFQKIGKGAEQIGEFFIPVGAGEALTAKAADLVPGIVKAVPKASRIAGAMVRGAVDPAIISAAQSGGDPDTIKNTALTGAAIGGTLQSAQEALPWIAKQAVKLGIRPSQAIKNRIGPEGQRLGLNGVTDAITREGVATPDQAQVALDKAVNDQKAMIDVMDTVNDKAAPSIAPTMEGTLNGMKDDLLERVTNPSSDIQLKNYANTAVTGEKFFENNVEDRAVALMSRLENAANHVPGAFGDEAGIPQDASYGHLQKMKQEAQNLAYSDTPGMNPSHSAINQQYYEELAQIIKNRLADASNAPELRTAIQDAGLPVNGGAPLDATNQRIGRLMVAKDALTTAFERPHTMASLFSIPELAAGIISGHPVAGSLTAAGNLLLSSPRVQALTAIGAKNLATKVLPPLTNNVGQASGVSQALYKELMDRLLNPQQ